MSKIQKILLAVLILVLVIVIILTWGSIGSITLLFSLFLIIPAYLYNRYLNNDQDSDFRNDDNS